MEYVTWKIAYLAAVVVVIVVEHCIFSRRWRRRELARRTMGIATVLALAFPLVVMGVFDLATYTWIWLAFGAAGALTAGMYIHECATAAEKKRRAFYEARAGKRRSVQ